MKWYSFFALTSLNLLIFIQTAIQLSVSALQPYMTDVYPSLDSLGSVAPSLIFLVILLPLGLVTPYVNKHVPLILTLTLASVVTLVGSILRFYLMKGYGLFMAGTVLVAFAQPFVINNQSIVSQRLVSDRYQGTFNGFVSMVGGAAGAIGWLTIPILIQSPQDAEFYLPKLEIFCLGLEGLATLFLILVYIGLSMDKGQKTQDAEAIFFQVKPLKKMTYHRLLHSQKHARQKKLEDLDEPQIVSRGLNQYAVTQGGLDSISNLFNNTLQLMMLNSTLTYTDWDIFMAGALFFIPVTPAPFLIGLIVDKLKKWGNFSIFLIILNALVTFGLVYTPNVNKILFFVFVTLYSITSGTVVTACLAFANVILSKVSDPKGNTQSTADGNSDTINSIMDWVAAAINFVLLFVSAYVSMNILNALVVATSVVISIVAVLILYRLPKRSEV